MAWFLLLLAGVMEIGWPLGLKAGWGAEGVRAWPVAGAVVAMIASGVLLMFAQRTIPMGTAYCVWTGIGAVGAFVAGILLYNEPATAARCASALLVACGVVGLKLFS